LGTQKKETLRHEGLLTPIEKEGRRKRRKLLLQKFPKTERKHEIFRMKREGKHEPSGSLRVDLSFTERKKEKRPEKK